MYITARRTATEGFIELSRHTPFYTIYEETFISHTDLSALPFLHYIRRNLHIPYGSLCAAPAAAAALRAELRRPAETGTLSPSRAPPMTPPPRPPACSTPWRPPLLYLPPLPLQRDAGAALEPAASAACATYPDPAGDGGGVLILPVCFLTPSIPLE